jgi:hypothetical protein
MSAFICNDPTILLTALWCCSGPDDHDLERIVRVLTEQNYASVNYRYDEDEKPPEIELDRDILEVLFEVSPERARGAIACYAYQACETPDWPQTEAQRLTQEALECAEGASSGSRKGWELPVNQESAWSEDDDPVEPAIQKLWAILEAKNKAPQTANLF